MFEGQKPDETIMNEVEKLLLIKTSNDSETFQELKKVVKQSWETEPENRPKIADVKERLKRSYAIKKDFRHSNEQSGKRS